MIKLIWATPNIDDTVAYIARVSNPANQDNPNIAGLLKFMMREGHVSPFEMANICVEINTTRDIGRQILRHRSFSFQEFSQRYQDVTKLGDFSTREARVQGATNRQSSLNTDSEYLTHWWAWAQKEVTSISEVLYTQALEKGIAKEQARALLPEGLTPSRMYMNGTLRSWIHYLTSRLHETTQKEHRDIATGILDVIRPIAPITIEAFFPV